MPTRYEQLRDAVRCLAAPAGEQVSYLDSLIDPVTGSAFAADVSDELALSLDDIFRAANDMISHGELREIEAAAIRPLDEALTSLSGEQNADFWQREALSNDERWNGIRTLAANALASLPEEKRAVGRSTGNGS